MKKIHYVIYICDNEIFFLNLLNEKIIKSKFKSIKEEQILNSELFTDEFSKFIKKNHIKISLFGDNICFLKNKNIRGVVLEKYLEIFKDYFHRIECKDLEDVLKIENNTGYLNITTNYLDYYFMKKNEQHLIRINTEIFNNNIKKAIYHIITTIYKPKKLIVLGNVENISSIAENINHDYNIATTFPEVHYNYIFEEYKK